MVVRAADRRLGRATVLRRRADLLAAIRSPARPAVASIEAFQEEGIVENAAAMGEVFRVELAKLAEKHPSIGEVRGLGCFWGLELVKNRETREPLVPFNGSGEAAKPSPRWRSARSTRAST